MEGILGGFLAKMVKLSIEIQKRATQAAALCTKHAYFLFKSKSCLSKVDNSVRR